MTAGIAFAGLAWIVVGTMQLVLDHGDVFTITWQVLPYVLLTFGEVLVATTGLEFAYSQAPLSMKGAIMAFWNLSVTIGNLWVLVANAGCAKLRGHQIHRINWFWRDCVSNVLLRCICLCRRFSIWRRRPHLSIVDHYRRHDE